MSANTSSSVWEWNKLTSSLLWPVAEIVKMTLREFRGNRSTLDAMFGGTVNTLDPFDADCLADTGRIRSAGGKVSEAEKNDAVRVTLNAAV